MSIFHKASEQVCQNSRQGDADVQLFKRVIKKHREQIDDDDATFWALMIDKKVNKFTDAMARVLGVDDTIKEGNSSTNFIGRLIIEKRDDDGNKL